MFYLLCLLEFLIVGFFINVLEVVVCRGKYSIEIFWWERVFFEWSWRFIMFVEYVVNLDSIMNDVLFVFIFVDVFEWWLKCMVFYYVDIEVCWVNVIVFDWSFLRFENLFVEIWDGVIMLCIYVLLLLYLVLGLWFV